MSVSGILLGIWLLLVGSSWLNWLTVDVKFLGLLAFITGILFLVESVHPFIRRSS